MGEAAFEVSCVSLSYMTRVELTCSLHSAHDEEKPFELEVSWICDASDRVFQRVPEDVLQAAEAAAKAALEESDMYVPSPLTCCLDVLIRHRSCRVKRSGYRLLQYDEDLGGMLGILGLAHSS